jgi:hypothetical protein
MDEHRTPIEGFERFRMPYLKIAAVAVFASAILAVGVLGPHPATPAASASPSTRPVAIVSPRPSPSAAPTLGAPRGIEALAGVTKLTPDPSAVHLSWLPDDITSRSLAAIGSRLFYVTTANKIRSAVVGTNEPQQTLVSVPACHAINQVAAAGHYVAYVVTSPMAEPIDANGCGTPGTVAWSVWVLDLRGGRPRQIATGLRDVGNVGDHMYPVQLALSPTTVAFDRPPKPSAGWSAETIEVYSNADGHLLWSTQTVNWVSQVMLGGPYLAVTVTGNPLQLMIASEKHPVLDNFAEPATTASIAPDGSYLAWDVASGNGLPAVLAVQSTAHGAEIHFSAPTDGTHPEPLRPVVSHIGSGALVAWLATAPGGTVYPAFRSALDGQAAGLLTTTIQEPAWLTLEGSHLIWVAADPAGGPAVAFEVDVSAFNLGGQ